MLSRPPATRAPLLRQDEWIGAIGKAIVRFSHSYTRPDDAADDDSDDDDD